MPETAYDINVRGPIAEPPLWVMKLTCYHGEEEVAPPGVFVKFHAEGAGPDFPPVILPAGQKNEGGHIWTEFGPLQGPTTVYTAQLVDGEGEALSPVALCDNKLRPIDWPILEEKRGYNRLQAEEATGGQVHAWFEIKAKLIALLPPPDPSNRVEELEAALERQRTYWLEVQGHANDAIEDIDGVLAQPE